MKQYSGKYHRQQKGEDSDLGGKKSAESEKSLQRHKKGNLHPHRVLQLDANTEFH